MILLMHLHRFINEHNLRMILLFTAHIIKLQWFISIFWIPLRSLFEFKLTLTQSRLSINIYFFQNNDVYYSIMIFSLTTADCFNSIETLFAFVTSFKLLQNILELETLERRRFKLAMFIITRVTRSHIIYHIRTFVLMLQSIKRSMMIIYQTDISTYYSRNIFSSLDDRN